MESPDTKGGGQDAVAAGGSEKIQMRHLGNLGDEVDESGGNERNRNRNLKFLKCYSKVKRTRAPAYSRSLRRIKGGFQRGGSREAQVRFPEYQEGTE